MFTQQYFIKEKKKNICTILKFIHLRNLTYNQKKKDSQNATFVHRENVSIFSINFYEL